MITLQDIRNKNINKNEVTTVYEITKEFNKLLNITVIDQQDYVDMTFFDNKHNLLCYCEAKWDKDRYVSYHNARFWTATLAELLYRCYLNKKLPPVLMILTHQGVLIFQTNKIQFYINRVYKLFDELLYGTPRHLYDYIKCEFHGNDYFDPDYNNIYLELLPLMNKFMNNIFIPSQISLEDIVNEINKLSN